MGSTPTPTSPTSPTSPASPGSPVTDSAAEEPDEGEQSASGHLYLSYVGQSHVGLVRKNNQDSGYASPTMLLVADGMGGAAAGDLASAVAVTIAAADDGAGDPVTGAAMLDVLSDTVRRANNKIADLVADDHSLEGMGTTVSGGLFDGSHFGVCHIGDSRIYLIRDGVMEPLTHDHSWVQSLIDEGNLTEEEAAYHPHRSLLIKVLNGHPTNVPDTRMVELREGDRLVLCSDGLCGFVDDADILARASEDSLDTALSDLVEAALQAGGIDNVTVIVAEVTAAPPDPVPEPMMLGAATETEIPEIEPRAIDLGDDDPEDEDLEDDPDKPHRPAAPAPADDGEAASRSAAGSATAATSDADTPDADPPTAATADTAATDSSGADGDRDEEEQRYAMATPPKRRWVPRMIGFAVIVILLAGLSVGAVAWGRTQYYVGAADGKVAIYQGLPQNVLGLPLSRIYEVQQVSLDDLPDYRRQQVEKTISANSLDDAYTTVSELKRMAERCREQREPPPDDPSPPENEGCR